jgi:hypothetical protein
MALEIAIILLTEAQGHPTFRSGNSKTEALSTVQSLGQRENAFID